MDKNELKKAHHLLKDRKLDEAREAYATFLAENPDNVEALNGLRQVCKHQEDYASVLEICERIIDLSPCPTADKFANMGYALNQLRRVEESIDAYKKAIKLKPTSARLYHKLAHVYRTNGYFDEAEAAYEQVFALDPKYIASYYPYSNIHKFTPNDTCIEKAKKLLAMPSTKGHNKVRMQFTMGKVFNDLGNYEEAFKYYKQANDTIAEEEPFDIEKQTTQVDRLIKEVTEPTPLLNYSSTHFQQTPIFIVGMTRSGKSLTEWVLAEHPRIISGGEGDEWHRALAEILPREPNGQLNRDLKNITQEQKQLIRKVFQELVSLNCPPSPYIIHSMPFGYWDVALILEVFPEAKVIHSIRNPWDNMWAAYCKYYQAQNGYSYSWDRLIPYYKNYQRLMDHWKELFGDRILTIHYENLCNKQTSEAKRVCSFLEIPAFDFQPLKLRSNQIGCSQHYLPYLQDLFEKEPLLEDKPRPSKN